MLRNTAYPILIALLVLLGGCKFTVHVGDGGDVDSLSGTRDCTEGQNCVFTITDFTFDEVFTAVPYVGYEFVRWQEGTSPGENFLCGGSTNPNCTVSNVGLSGDALAQQIVASNETYRIAAVFQPATGYLGNTSTSLTALSFNDAALSAACRSDYGQGAKLCNTKELFESPSFADLVPGTNGVHVRPYIISTTPRGSSLTDVRATDYSGYDSLIGSFSGCMRVTSSFSVAPLSCSVAVPAACCR